MKARIQKEQVLLYHLGKDTEKGLKTHNVLDSMGIPYREIPEEALGDKVGILAGVLPAEGTPDAYSGSIPKEEALILKDFSDKRLDQLLAAIKRAGVGSIPFKAVLTEHNRNWSFIRLFKELNEERRTIEAFHQLKSLTERTQTTWSNIPSPSETLKQVLQQAVTLLSGRRPMEADELLAAHKNLLAALPSEEDEPIVG